MTRERATLSSGDGEEARRMPDGFLAPPAKARPPRTPPPPGAVDCHAHVFGPFEAFPLASERHYTPAELPGERYLRTLDEIGFERGVLVQASAHGADCRAMLDALDRAPSRLRGIALATPDVSDAVLADMNRRGVRGLRFSQAIEAPGKGAIPLEAALVMGPRIAALGWHMQIQADCDRFARFAPDLLGIGIPIVLDHMGLVEPGRSLTDPNWRLVLDWVARGAVWVKLTPYRMSAAYPDYQDMAPFHHALVRANPARMLWGSDWPHVHMRANMPELGCLLDVLARWTSDEALIQRILVDNPVALYGF
jgi:predicted TIM-barrel fold metal-dependent hydrolase